MSEDVLVEYAAVIYEASKQDRGYESARDDDKQDAIRDLAAALRAERLLGETDKTCIEELGGDLLNQLARVSELEAILSQAEKRVAELEMEKRLASDWECSSCGRINPGTMPHCPCREEY
jgi:hypothetical protein